MNATVHGGARRRMGAMLKQSSLAVLAAELRVAPTLCRASVLARRRMGAMLRQSSLAALAAELRVAPTLCRANCARVGVLGIEKAASARWRFGCTDAC